MRPLQLTMTAFGPFPGTEQIDFSRLGENPLFLINGPTGSGKTTILDALCFALYGKTTGDERDGSQMCCDLAPAETLTEVTLTFELAGCCYRIRRLPEQQRPKARGEGTTTQSPEAQLYQLLDDGSEKLLVSSKVTEASKFIEQLTGLSVDQFRQVMVLPQGQFRQLLLAESAEREKIFSQLFQTRIYKRLEDSLKERSAVIRRQRNDLKERQQGMLEAVDLDSPEGLILELQAVKPQVEQALQLMQAKEQQFICAGNVLQQAQTLKTDFGRLAAVDTELEQLQLQKNAIDRQRQRLQLAEFAAKLQPVFREAQRCEGELKQSVTAVAEALKQKMATATQLTEAEQQLAAAKQLQLELDRVKQQAAQLYAYRSRVQQLDEARRRSGAAQLQAVIAELRLNYRQLSDQRLLRQKVIELQRNCVAQETLLAEKNQQGTRLSERFHQLEQQTKALELSWHRGQAAILASELRAGEACPVCGSSEHPSPASSAQPLPSQQQVEQARNDLQKAQKKLEDTRENYREELSRLRELQAELERLGCGLSVDSERSLADIDGQLKVLRHRAAELRVDLPSLQQIQDCDLVTLQNDFDHAKAVELSSRTQAASAEQELPQEYRQPGTLAAAENALQQQIGQLQRQIDTAVTEQQQALGQAKTAAAAAEAAEQQRQRNSNTLELALAACQVRLAESPFASEEEYLNALLAENDHFQVKEQVVAYDVAFQRLSGAQQQLQNALRDKQRPDLAGLELQLSSAEADKSAAVRQWQQLDKRFSLLNSTQQKLARATTQLSELDRQYALIGTLSDVANGQTGNKISLQRFVLSVLLDDVLIAASQRLNLMSKGRYQLLRKEDRTKGNKASGLELEVEDAYTGKLRSVATLSGGESFMAALSLALGLSDVVQAYAGGIRLDTLFIDEGFGSLDPESLDLAIRTLIDLQATGRMIGIISHVAELKEQLPLRIDVLTDRLGSYTRLVTV